MLVAGAIAVPAFGDTSTPRIGNDVEEREDLDTSWTDWHLVDANNPADVFGTIHEIHYFSTKNKPMRFFIVDKDLVVQWRSDEFDAGEGSGAHHIPGSVPVEPGDMLGMYFKKEGTISSTADEDGIAYSPGENSGLPSVGQEIDGQRTVDRIYSLMADIIVFDDVDECEEGGDCTVSAGGFNATVPGQDGARIGLRLPDPEDPTTQAIDEACGELVGDSVRRLGDDVAHIVPVGFDGGDITVTSTIDEDVVYGQEDEARGEGIFDVCVAPEKPDYAGYGGEDGLDAIKIEDDDSGFYGPILLENCRGGPFAKGACVESREKDEDGNVVLTYRIPAEDPMLR